MKTVKEFAVTILSYLAFGVAGWFVLPVMWAAQEGETLTPANIANERLWGIVLYGGIGAIVGVGWLWGIYQKRRDAWVPVPEDATEDVAPPVPAPMQVALDEAAAKGGPMPTLDEMADAARARIAARGWQKESPEP
jgi:hypothetical protein